MATKTIIDFEEKTTIDDADLMLTGNNGTASLRKITWANVSEKIKTKIITWLFSDLSTQNKTIIGAINEVYGAINEANESINEVDKKYYKGIATGNLDEILEPGDYWISAGYTTNTPTGYGVLEVRGVTDGIGSTVQRITEYSNHAMYVRLYANNMWYAWVKYLPDQTPEMVQ